MSKFIVLTQIDLRSEREARENGRQVVYTPVAAPPQDSGRFDQLDYDELERPLPAPTYVYPTHVAAAHIREFHARKKNAQGTRIVFANGSAIVVTEPLDEVALKLSMIA